MWVHSIAWEEGIGRLQVLNPQIRTWHFVAGLHLDILGIFCLASIWWADHVHVSRSSKLGFYVVASGFSDRIVKLLTKLPQCVLVFFYRSEKQPSWASHVREKGDLFYVEPYVEPPCHPYSPLEHSHLTDHSPNAKAGKPKKVVFKKLNSVKNFFSGANDEKELESCLEEHNRRNSSWGGDSQGSRMSTDKFVIKDVNLLVNPPALRAGVRHDLETVLGIIPGHEQTTPAEKSRICIKGFVPDGPALQSGELRISKERCHGGNENWLDMWWRLYSLRNQMLKCQLQVSIRSF